MTERERLIAKAKQYGWGVSYNQIHGRVTFLRGKTHEKVDVYFADDRDDPTDAPQRAFLSRNGLYSNRPLDIDMIVPTLMVLGSAPRR